MVIESRRVELDREEQRTSFGVKGSGMKSFAESEAIAREERGLDRKRERRGGGDETRGCR